MGIKELWTVLTPYCERKPFYELRGKTVAIDLAGWVCESLNVVDYFVHPRQHLKNLFFRTCYLIWEEVTPVFVLEGTAPKLKAQTISKRNEIQFRGVKPKESPPTQSDSGGTQEKPINKEKGRTRFNHVLKQCENLLRAMGITCVQGPGEAEAYCAFLNKKGLVDGVISQDSDCFAYGAIKVYRNFSVSTQGTSSAQGGAVDLYDMERVCKGMDFGQNKIIVMGLLCGCDYCPDGVGGVGRDGVMKLFNRYSNDIIIDRLKAWKLEDHRFSALEMRVDDKNICANCGHLGKTASHTKSGCAPCGSHRGCDSSLWKEERLSLKSELTLRKKALVDPLFPSQEIIDEFLTEPQSIPKLDLSWKQPNIVKFLKQVGHLLQWQEIYCFQKFFPLLTRWQVRFITRQPPGAVAYVVPDVIVKKRTVKGVASLEIRWKDQMGFFAGLIPDEQMKIFIADNPKGSDDLWSTVEPLNLMEESYPDLVKEFITSKEKPKKVTKPRKTKPKASDKQQTGSLNDLSALLEVTNEIAKTLKPKKPPSNPKPRKGLQMIDKFLVRKQSQPQPSFNPTGQCSTPKTKCIPSDLESDCDEDFNMSDIISGMIKNAAPPIAKHAGRLLHYEPVNWERSVDDLDLITSTKQKNLSLSFLEKSSKKVSTECGRSVDDFHLSPKITSKDDRIELTKSMKKRNLSLSFLETSAKRISIEREESVKELLGSSIGFGLDDSIDLSMAMRKISSKIHSMKRDMSVMSIDDSIDDLIAGKENISPAVTHVDRFLNKYSKTTPRRSLVKDETDCNTSYFFGGGANDEFEKSMNISFHRKSVEEDAILISDSSYSDGDG